MPEPAARRDLVLCVDVGSTYTKVGLIDLDAGRQVATASHPTTSSTDVLHGVQACRAELDGRGFPTAGVAVLACSSAGGGLRIAVVGHELAVTGEAGRRAALSSGGQVVSTVAGPLTVERWAELVRSRPDLVLLSGGTDGGNATSILAAARVLADRRCAAPVVVAGNADAAGAVGDVLASAGVQHVLVANLVPQIGRYAPDQARATVRALFLSHVIGGKGLSTGQDFARLVQGATPDIVLAAVELIGPMLPGGLAVVDVGGATTDVYSYVAPPGPSAASSGVSRELVAPRPPTAPWKATRRALVGGHHPGARQIRRADHRCRRRLGPDAGPDRGRRRPGPARRPLGEHLRREATHRTRRGPGPAGGRAADRVRWVFRADPAQGRTLLSRAVAQIGAAGRLLPHHARVLVDDDYLLAPIGLLAARHPQAARALALTLTG